MGNRERLCELGYEDAIVLEGFDDAIIGTLDDGRAVYSFDRMVDCLVRVDGMTYEEAVEYICFNTLRALPYLGESAPVVMMNEELFAGDGD